MRKLLLSGVGLGLLISSAACAPDESAGEVGEDLTGIPDGVGFVFADELGTYENCVATLISPTQIATHSSCLSAQFFPVNQGGASANVKLYFVQAKAVSNRASWIEISKATRYQFAALGTLARPSSATPIPVARTPLAAGDVGTTFMAPVVAGGRYAPVLKLGSTQLRAVTGQGMKAIYPTLADWANAMDSGPGVSQLISGGPNGPNAGAWHRPLRNGYEVLTRGRNEETMLVSAGKDTVGSPLLRKTASGYEIVAIDASPTGARTNLVEGRSKILATYYLSMTRDIAAFLSGQPFAENHCLGVERGTGVCLDGFAYNCSDSSDPPRLEDPLWMASYCAQAACVVNGTASCR